MGDWLREVLVRPTFVVPTILALTSLSALVIALIDEGLVDWIAWGLLSLPVLALAWAWRHRYVYRRCTKSIPQDD